MPNCFSRLGIEYTPIVTRYQRSEGYAFLAGLLLLGLFIASYVFFFDAVGVNAFLSLVSVLGMGDGWGLIVAVGIGLVLIVTGLVLANRSRQV